MEHSTKVKNYYENNTRRFLWLHRDDATKSIHQPLWKEDSFTTQEAFFYSNKLILEEVTNHFSKYPLTILDLGCGVGSSIFYLEEHFRKKAYYCGVTISAIQVSIATQRVKQLKLSSTIQFIEADFTNLPKEVPTVDIAFSIEAFAHASNANKYFEQIRQKLNKGGKVILIDDFLNNAIDYNKLDEKDKRAIIDFKYGWLVDSLKTTIDLKNISEKYGFRVIKETDLTPYMRNNTLKHKWIWLIVTSFRWLYELSPWKSYYFRSWIGGVAKQYCLKRGIVKYKKLVFESV